jgi:hypothetical protein
VNYNPSPQSEFAKNPQLVKNHHDLVEKPNLRLSIETALLEYQRRQSNNTVTDIGSCAVGYLRLQGAQQFVDLFYNLAESTTKERAADVVNLPGNIKGKAN